MVFFGDKPMANWYEYRSPFKDKADNPAVALTRRIANFEGRLSDLERRVGLLEGGFADQTHYSWGNGKGDAYYHRQQDLAGTMERFAPWVSTTSRIAADLTSSQTVKRTLGEASLAGIFFTATGGFLAGLGQIPWYGAPIVGFTGASLTLAVLVAHNRTLLHKLVTSQADRGVKRRQEMRVQIGHAGDHSIDFLYLNSNVTEEQLAEFARAAIGGASLAVHKWTGQGALFTRGQFDDLMTELEKMNYVRPASGNVGRMLTARGRALMRGLADRG
jgi:hypothetical protein